MKNPCQTCITLSICSQKIISGLEYANEDLSFLDPEKCEGNPDEWMEDLISDLADECSILKSYLNDKNDLNEFLSIREIHNPETEVIKKASKILRDLKEEDLQIFFGKKAGIDFYQWDGWSITKEGLQTSTKTGIRLYHGFVL